MQREYVKQGKLLYKLRTSEGISQEKLAVAIGVHKQCISNIERYTAPIPPAWVPSLCRVFGKGTSESFLEAYVEDSKNMWMKKARIHG